MYIDKWWGNVTCGDTDDSMLLIDYIVYKNKRKFTLIEILKDAHIDNVLGKKPLCLTEKIDCYFCLDINERKFRADLQIPINLIIDLSAFLLQSYVEKYIIVRTMDKKYEFSVAAKNEDLILIIAELENAIRKPNLYYPVFLQDEFSEMINGIVEIIVELKSYLEVDE